MVNISKNKYTKPKLLKKGDTIAFIAPAGPVKDKSAIERAKDYLSSCGYKVIYSEHLFNNYKYLSDTDKNRLSDLHWAFSDKSVDAIICARGGYGSLRLINDIDYEIIKYNPKPFCGYSDITVLSLAFLNRAGLITYSAPMARGDFGSENVSEYTMTNFFKTLCEDETQIFKSDKPYREGLADGIIWGGNLASVVSLCGTDFVPDEDFIFFAEDLNEPVYKIDKMFTQLFNISNFKQNLKGIILGDFLDSGYPEQLDELFVQIGETYSIPVLGGYKITHNSDKITVPIGLVGEIKNNEFIF